MYSFSLFPMFWINEWNISRNTFYLMIAMNEFIIWIYIMYCRFCKKLSKTRRI